MAVPIGAIVKGAQKAKQIKGKADNAKDNIKEKTGLKGGVSDESREQEAEKSGMEKITQKPKQMAMKMVKLIMALVVKFFVMMLIKFLPIIIALILISSLFGWLIDDDDDSSSGGIIVGAVGTTTPDSDMTVDPEEGEGLDTGEIEEFINNFDSEDGTLKDEMLTNAENISNWQNTYRYDARILIALAFDEANGATEFDLNEFITTDMANAASAWNEQRLTTPREFVTQYICDREGIEPEDISTAQMLKVSIIVKNIGIAEQASGISGEQEASGDGYTSKRITSYGRTFINYKQNLPGASYNGLTYYDGNIGNRGCPMISAAIILSGYERKEINIQNLYNISYSGGFIFGNVVNYGKNEYKFERPHAGRTTQLSEAELEPITNSVKNGIPVIIHGMKKEGSILTSNTEHWVALLDYNSSTDKFYVSDPNVYNSDLYDKGWISRDTLFKGCTEYAIIKLEKDNVSGSPSPTPIPSTSNAIGVMAKEKYDNAVNSTSFASPNVEAENAFSSGADILTLAECDGKVASFIAISNTGEFIKHNTSKEMNYQSIIKLPTMYSIAHFEGTRFKTDLNSKEIFWAPGTSSGSNTVPESYPNNGAIEDVTGTLEDAIKWISIKSNNAFHELIGQKYLGMQSGTSTESVKWLRNPDNLGVSGDYYKGTADYGERRPQDVTMGGGVWGSGTVLRPIRWMYAIATNELGVDADVYNTIMNYASQCATPAKMTAKSGYTIYQKTGSGETMHGHDIGIVVNNTTKDFYIYAIMLENDSNDTKDCPKIADEIFNVMKGYI